jgi:iron complex transport system substrate-binding protein
MRSAQGTTAGLRRVLLAAGLAAGLALTACSAASTSGSDGTQSPSPTGPAATSSTAGSSTAPAFPVTVDSAYGGVTVTAAPERIVALTAQVADILVSLGVQPVATAVTQQQIDDQSPWLDGQLTGALDPELTNADYSINTEKILSYQPDLIVGDSWQIPDQATFDTLISVAPTYAGAIKGNTDWDVLTSALGDIVGEPAAAQDAIAGVEATFATTRDQLSSLQGKTYQWVRFATSEGFAFGNGSWLEQFGLQPAANQDNSMQSAGISLENLDQLNADVLAIWAYDGEQDILEADPRFQALPSTQAGLVLWAHLKVAYATNGPGPLSLVYVNDVVTPLLAAGAGTAG